MLFYEAKVPFSERCIAVWKCHHAIELLRHSYHTLALSKEVYNFVFAQGVQKLLVTIKEIWTFIFWWLITFEPLEQKQSYIPFLKVLMCGMNSYGVQQHAGNSILWYTSLKMALLLHKTALVNFPMATTVLKWNQRHGFKSWLG